MGNFTGRAKVQQAWAMRERSGTRIEDSGGVMG